MMNQLPLQYKITNWRDLPKCLSNNSRELRIHITDLFNNDLITGFRISVDHPLTGTLFACVLEANGVLVSDVPEYSPGELSKEAILNELKKYGFLIEFAQELGISGPQLDYLMTLRGLGYDKIRIISVWEYANYTKQSEPKIVAFQSNSLSDWLNNTYSPSKQEFIKALDEGTAVNLTHISKTKQYRWDWLKDEVDNIDDILAQNAAESGDD